MADSLQQLSIWLIENLCANNVDLLKEPLDNNQLQNLEKDDQRSLTDAARAVSRIIGSLKTKTKLPPVFNLKHVIAEHSRFYEIKNCEGEHCFDCLYHDMQDGKLTCEHSKSLTPYEQAHINYLFINTQ